MIASQFWLPVPWVLKSPSHPLEVMVTNLEAAELRFRFRLSRRSRCMATNARRRCATRRAAGQPADPAGEPARKTAVDPHRPVLRDAPGIPGRAVETQRTGLGARVPLNIGGMVMPDVFEPDGAASFPISSRNYQIRTGAERYAVNFPIQGSAADILKRAMIDVDRELVAAESRARMILTVHDELLFEAPKEAADETSALVRERMEAAVRLTVPLTVEVGVGENWKEAKG